MPGPLSAHLGELTHTLIELGADHGVAVEMDTSDRTRPGEQRGGASPIEAIALLVVACAAGFGRRQVERLAERAFDAAVDWALRHRRKQADAPGDPDPIAVTLYGPNGERIKDVLVPQGQGDAPPQDRMDP